MAYGPAERVRHEEGYTAMAIDTVTARSRRALLIGAVGGLAATVAAAIGRPLPAHATTDGVSYVNDENAGTVISAASLQSFGVPTSGSGDAVRAQSHSGKGVHAESSSGVGLYATSDTGSAIEAWNNQLGAGLSAHGNPAVHGMSQQDHGAAILGSNEGFAATGVRGEGVSSAAQGGASYGVWGDGLGPGGIGVFGYAADPAGPGGRAGVWGQTPSTSGDGVRGYASAGNGTTSGVSGESSSAEGVGVLGRASGGASGVMGISGADPIAASPVKTGVYAYAGQDGAVGVHGVAPLGRGGRFKGAKAQIRLDPSTATTHPNSGQAGDIFVDKSKRVWFCKGTTNWVRLDT